MSSILFFGEKMSLLETHDIYYYFGMVMSSFIVIFFSMSTIYGILYQIKKKYRIRPNWPVLYTTILSFLWVIIFGYVLVNDLLGVQVLCPSTFGGTYIRPAIMLTGFSAAISQKLRFEKLKLFNNKGET
jgi:hypothetical protein